MTTSKTDLQFADTEPLPRPGQDFANADTEPMPLTPSERKPFDVDGLGLSLAPVGAGEYELMAETRKDGRVCPLPTRWLEFHRVLQEAARGAQLPAPPLTGSAWASSSATAKRNRFNEQAAWAVRTGCIVAACEFLQALPASDWYYGN